MLGAAHTMWLAWVEHIRGSTPAVLPDEIWWQVPLSDETHEPQPPRASPKANTAPASKRADRDQSIFPSSSEYERDRHHGAPRDPQAIPAGAGAPGVAAV